MFCFSPVYVSFRLCVLFSEELHFQPYTRFLEFKQEGGKSQSQRALNRLIITILPPVATLLSFCRLAQITFLIAVLCSATASWLERVCSFNKRGTLLCLNITATEQRLIKQSDIIVNRCSTSTDLSA